MLTLKLTLDTRRLKKNKTYPVIFRLSVNGDSRDIKTGSSVSKTDWNNRTRSVKNTHPDHAVINKNIDELRLKYLNRILTYERSHPWHLNAQELRDYLLQDEKTANTITVHDFWQQEIDLMQKADRNGGARIYMETLVALTKIRSLQIKFEQIDYKFLKEVEAELISKGVKINSISLYLRTLRAIYNKAINTGLISYSTYPFRAFKIKKQKITPVVMNQEELYRYFNLQLDSSSWLYESWLLGKLMFMLIGINFKDMLLMTELNINTGRLIYTRAKTGRVYSIKLLPEAQEIINYFRGRSELTLLGRLTEAELENKLRLPLLIRQKNKIFNKHLGKLGKMVGSTEKLRGYVFRYSWANLSRSLGYSKDMIGNGLGHNVGSSTTEIYLLDYNPELIDRMNEEICRSVMYK